MAQPHDHLFQVIFADPEHARPLLRSALPTNVAGEINWQTLVRRSPTQRGRRKKLTICDVLFSVRLLGGRELLLYVVLEHKSKSTRFDALQMLEQVVAMLRTHQREHQGERFLPPVLPVVVHASQRPWASPLDVRELFDVENLPEAIQTFLPAMAFALDDLHDKPAEHLRQRALTLFGLCALSMLQYLPPAARDERKFVRWLDAWGDVQDRAAKLAIAPSAHELYAAVVDYILETSNLPGITVHRAMSQRITDDAMKKFVSTRTQIRNEGLAEGKALGIVAGKAEGKALGRAEILLRQLARRFGALDDAAITLVRHGTPSELDLWADRVLDAESLAEVLADSSAPE